MVGCFLSVCFSGYTPENDDILFYPKYDLPAINHSLPCVFCLHFVYRFSTKVKSRTRVSVRAQLSAGL
jgi:hypothetical protein